MSIETSQFYRAKENLGPRTVRYKADYEKFQKANNRKPNEPVPVKYLDDRKFDPLDVFFPSARSLVEYVRGIPGWPSCMRMDNDSEENNKDWNWGFNVADSIKLFDKGWDKGFAAIKHGMDEAATAAMLAAMPEVTPQRDMHGSFIDIDGYIKGEPDCMFEFQEQVQPVLHLEVEVDSFYSGGSTADEILYRGAAILSAVMALRRTGVFVTLYMKEHCSLKDWTGRTRKHTVQVNLMNQGMTENLSEALIVIGHPGFYRSVFFTVFASAWGDDTGSLGRQARDTEDFVMKPGSGKVVIPGHFHETTGLDDGVMDWGNTWASPRAAELMVKALLMSAAQK